jgi:polysaccharide biosynthesis protein PslH
VDRNASFPIGNEAADPSVLPPRIAAFRASLARAILGAQKIPPILAIGFYRYYREMPITLPGVFIRSRSQLGRFNMRHGDNATGTSESVTETDLMRTLPKQRLRWLWLTRFDPRLPDAGDLAYSYHLLVSLGNAGSAITVLTMERALPDGQRAPADGIEWTLIPDDAASRVFSAIRRMFNRLPNVAHRCSTRKFRLALNAQLAKEWDVICIDHLGMGWAWPRVKAYCHRYPRTISVFVTHNCEGKVRRAMARNYRGNLLLKVGLHLDALKSGLLEREMLRTSTLFSVNTAEDRLGFGNLAKSVIILPGYAGRRIRSRDITAATPRRALIFGATIWFAKQMNLIEFLAAADELFWHNQVELWVVGRVPDHLRAANHYRATSFLGFIQDPEPIFRDARIGIIAERTGGGFKHKSLDFIFHRLPIAATQGSFSGVPLTPNKDYLSFTSVGELAQGVVAAIDDLDHLNALQKAAYAKCSAAFDWAERGRILLRAIGEAASKQTPTKVGARRSDPDRRWARWERRRG